MATPTFSLARYQDPATVALANETDQKTLAVWARDCTERVLPYFERDFPHDRRPRHALEALQAWIDTGVFSMARIRKASLDAHAAARDAGADCEARSAARAAGQAVATAHVPLHALGAAAYACQAVYHASNPAVADTAVAREREWQLQHLHELRGDR